MRNIWTTRDDDEDTISHIEDELRSTKMAVKVWLVEFYAGPTTIDGKPQKPVEVVEVKRVYAPTRWARNHVLTLKRRLKRADIDFSIMGF